MKILTRVNQDIEVDVFVGDVIQEINELEITQRWNYLATLIEGIKVEEIASLTDSQKSIIRNYLKKSYKRFDK